MVTFSRPGLCSFCFSFSDHEFDNTAVILLGNPNQVFVTLIHCLSRICWFLFSLDSISHLIFRIRVQKFSACFSSSSVRARFLVFASFLLLRFLFELAVQICSDSECGQVRVPFIQSLTHCYSNYSKLKYPWATNHTVLKTHLSVHQDKYYPNATYFVMASHIQAPRGLEILNSTNLNGPKITSFCDTRWFRCQRA